jgi:predicted nucleotidyltransferase
MRHRRRPTGMQNNGTAHIAAVAARLMAEDGLDDVELAKRKAAHQLNLPEWIGLPSSQAVYDALRTHQAIFQDSEQRERIAGMRQEALYWMELLADFHPYLTGSVLDGTAGRYSMIDILLYPDSDKDVEIFLLNRGVAYEHMRPRNDRTAAVLQVARDTWVTNLVIYPSHDERVVFRHHDGTVRERARIEAVRERLKIDALLV